MEQIANPKVLLDTIEKAQAGTLEALDDTQSAWDRLSEASIDTKRARRHGLVCDPYDPAGIPFERLRARIMSLMSATGHTRIGLTAAAAGYKSHILAGNLALAFANLPDFKTILFDLDLRTPKLPDAMGLSRIGPRFSALSGTRRGFDSTALRLSEGLAVSLNNTAEQNPSRLLASRSAQSLLDEIETDLRPDLMLFNLPPMFPEPEALSALTLVNGAFVVAQAGHSTIRQIDAAERGVQEQSECFGVLLTECAFAARPQRANDLPS